MKKIKKIMNEMVQLETHVINQNGSIMHMIVAIVKNTLKAQSSKPQAPRYQFDVLLYVQCGLFWKNK